MSLSVLDLFAGAGGLSVGLEAAGLDVIGAIEMDQWAADTYAFNNASTKLWTTDIRDVSDHDLAQQYSGTDLVVGGPPCQGFSVSGKRQYGVHHPKNQLVHEFVRAISVITPPLLILENVRGLVSARLDGRKRALQTILDPLADLGYHLYPRVLQAADYGVPQYRSRLFVIGSRVELSSDPFPEPTHSPNGSKMTLRHLGVLGAISDLPPLDAGEGTDAFQRYSQGPKNEFQRSARRRSRGVFNHVAMGHTSRLIERFRDIKPGGKSYQIGRVGDKTSTVTVYKSNNQRLVSSLPSLCITANFQSTYVHPTRHRNLTAREAARIQTFPDSYRFLGKRTLMSSSLLAREGRHAENYLSQYNQIGNAVPPLLARVVTEQLLKVFSMEDRLESDRSRRRNSSSCGGVHLQC